MTAAYVAIILAILVFGQASQPPDVIIVYAQEDKADATREPDGQ